MSTAHGLARTLSKLGFCSRAEAFRLVAAGRVTLNGRVCRDPEQRTVADRDRIAVDGRAVAAAARAYFMLNKPRGLVTTTSDEQGRSTVFECFRGATVPAHLSPVGRLDQASEGLLLFTNDTAWAARLTDPTAGVEKTYHVQVDQLMDEAWCRRLEAGVADGGEHLAVKRAVVLRGGTRNAWLELVLDEGRNRHLRRLCGALGLEVRRLVRVRIGGLALGSLAKGAFRPLTRSEITALAPVGPSLSHHAGHSGADERPPTESGFPGRAKR